jgi:3-oxoacyl-[acyl-carrier protein] reductase
MKRTVLITGITSGIGFETAIKFAEAGWDVLGHYHSASVEAERLKGALSKFGVQCQLWQADLTSETETVALISRLDSHTVDSLINNAGSYVTHEHFTQLTAEAIMKTFAVNTVAPILFAGGLFDRMKERGFGRIVNISSIAAKYGGSSESLHYGCAKRALEGLTRTLAREGAPYNILANSVRPGVIDTEFHRRFPKDMKKRVEMIPLKRMGRAEEVAELVFYLGSDRNTFVTNETIAVAGGE